MRSMFRALFIYGMAGAAVSWFGLLAITIANMVISMVGAFSLGSHLLQMLLAAVILLLLTLLLLGGLKLLLGAATKMAALGKVAQAGANVGAPQGGWGKLAKGLARLDAGSLRDAGNLASRAGLRNAGRKLRAGSRMRNALDESKELKKLQSQKNSGKLKKGGAEAELPEGKNKAYREKVERASRDKKVLEKELKLFMLDADGNKLKGDAKKEAASDKEKFYRDVHDAQAIRKSVPELDKLKYDDMMRLMEGEMPMEEQMQKGVAGAGQKIKDKMFRQGVKDGKYKEEDYAKFMLAASDIGGIPSEHQEAAMDATDEERARAEAVHERDQASREIADKVNSSHPNESIANSEVPGEESMQKGMNVSQTHEEKNSNTLNYSTTGDSHEAQFSDPKKELEVSSGSSDIRVAEEVAVSNAKRDEVLYNNLAMSQAGMPEGDTNSLKRDDVLERDEKTGNAISSVEKDEVIQAASVSGAGTAIHGTTLPESVTDAGEFSANEIARATQDSADKYATGMSDPTVVDNDTVMSGLESSDTDENTLTPEGITGYQQESTTDSNSVYSSIENAGQEPVEAVRTESATAQHQQQQVMGIPADQSSTPEPAQQQGTSSVPQAEDASPMAGSSSQQENMSTPQSAPQENVPTSQSVPQQETSFTDGTPQQETRTPQSQSAEYGQTPQQQYSAPVGEPTTDTFTSDPGPAATSDDFMNAINEPSADPVQAPRSESAPVQQQQSMSAPSNEEGGFIVTREMMEEYQTTNPFFIEQKEKEKERIAREERAANYQPSDAEGQNPFGPGGEFYTAPQETQQPQQQRNPVDPSTNPFRPPEPQETQRPTQQGETFSANGQQFSEQPQFRETDNVSSSSVYDSLSTPDVQQVPQQQAPQQAPQQQAPQQAPQQQEPQQQAPQQQAPQQQAPQQAPQQQVPQQQAPQQQGDVFSASGQQFSEQTPQSVPMGTGAGFLAGMIPGLSNDGKYGDRNVDLSSGTMRELRGIMESMTDDLARSQRQSDALMAGRISDLESKFEKDLRESGQFTEEEISEESRSIREALRLAMERKDDELEELDNLNIGKMTNKGSSGKLKRPEN